LVSAAGLLAAAEALVVGRRFGLDPTRMLEVLNASTGRNYATEQKLAQFVLSRRFDAGFSLALMVKDLGTALDLAHETHTPAPLAAKCRALWTRAAAALEPDAAHLAILRWVEAGAGGPLGGAGCLPPGSPPRPPAAGMAGRPAPPRRRRQAPVPGSSSRTRCAPICPASRSFPMPASSASLRCRVI